MCLGLLDSNQRSSASSGVGAQATRTLLRRPARTTYHDTIRPNYLINTSTVVGPFVCIPSKILWGALSLNSGVKAGLDMDNNELVGA